MTEFEIITLWDVDGTLAEKGDRGPFDWAKVGEDTPRMDVVENFRALAPLFRPVFFSGRSEECRWQTIMWLTWLENKPTKSIELYMRKKGDYRPDYIVKEEMYDTFIANRYEVHMVFDDRNQVVDMWRRKGVPCYQVVSREVGNF